MNKMIPVPNIETPTTHPMHAVEKMILYNNRAAGLDKLGRVDECIADCTSAFFSGEAFNHIIFNYQFTAKLF